MAARRRAGRPELAAWDCEERLTAGECSASGSSQIRTKPLQLAQAGDHTHARRPAAPVAVEQHRLDPAARAPATSSAGCRRRARHSAARTRPAPARAGRSRAPACGHPLRLRSGCGRATARAPDAPARRAARCPSWRPRSTGLLGPRARASAGAASSNARKRSEASSVSVSDGPLTAASAGEAATPPGGPRHSDDVGPPGRRDRIPCRDASGSRQFRRRSRADASAGEIAMPWRRSSSARRCGAGGSSLTSVPSASSRITPGARDAISGGSFRTTAPESGITEGARTGGPKSAPGYTDPPSSGAEHVPVAPLCPVAASPSMSRRERQRRRQRNRGIPGSDGPC